ncbi:hypothetical protein A9Q84_12360 [Halobacteriovorax marinus]|uniref:Uncharacterized protein n=1 Tax=Halobacteriovorax marinus TaxID=97084 RepID=A0A1Y5F868_9BACT|nr:hypothetical protein A9Q84_12360 [Halobacteriovorax marinus]
MKLVIVLLHLFTLSAFSAPKENSEKVKRMRLLSMIGKEIKSIKKVKRRGPNLEYRLLELYSENLKIIKEVENGIFLRNRNKSLKKKHFFIKSMKLNKKVEKLGRYITKKWKNYRSNAAIYYTLALNERDFNDSKRTKYYLRKSLTVAPNNSPIVHSVKTSLAELYYNDKLYKKAIKYYVDVIKNTGDEWYAKHHYNFGWCLLKTRRQKAALNHLLKAYQVSKNPRYVTVESQILDAISIFFIQNNKLEEGTKFYLKNVEEPAEYLTKFATRAQSSKKYHAINKILLAGVSSAKDKKQYGELVLYYNYQLEFYRTFKKEEMHLRVAKKLTALNKLKKINDEDKEISISRIKSFVGYLQVRISKNQMNVDEEQLAKKLDNVLIYFKLLKNLDPEKIKNYTFFQGETLYSVKKFRRAYTMYAKALEYIKSDQVAFNKLSNEKKQTVKSPWDDKFSKKVINSLLATLSKLEENESVSYKLKSYVYSNHINLWPKDQKSRLIYPKLYSIYFKHKKINQAVKVITSYNSHFKQDLESQKGMFAKVFDHYVLKKDITKITYWINQFNKGFLSYENQYVKKATIILANLLFNEIDKIIAKGDYKKAKGKYLEILKNKNYPQKIKTQSSYRIAILDLKSLNIKSSWAWMRKSFKQDKSNELFKEIKNINNMVIEYSQAQDFRRALSLSYNTLKKFCHKKYPQKVNFFKNAIIYSVIENNDRAILKLKKVSSKCNIDLKYIKKDISNFASNFALEGNLKRLFWFKSNFPKFINNKLITEVAEKSYWRFIGQGNTSQARTMLNIMNKYHSGNTSVITNYKIFVKKYSKANFNFNTTKFDGQIFNKEIEKNINHLKEIVIAGKSIQNSKHPMITPKVSAFVASLYGRFLAQLENYTPFGFNKKEARMFKDQLSPLINNIVTERNNYNTQAINTIRSNSILSFDNHNIKESNSTKANVLIRYPASLLSLSLDVQGAE